jgi:hypothetical protein
MIGPTDNLKRFLTQAPPGDAWIDTLELTHPAWGQPYVLAAYDQPFTVTFEDGRRYDARPVGFSVELPDAGTQGRQEMAITIDNVGAEIWDALELAQAQPQFPIRVTWRAYLRSQPNVPSAAPLALAVVNVTATPQVVQMVAARSDTINMRWPRVVYKPSRWPGLVR